MELRLEDYNNGFQLFNDGSDPITVVGNFDFANNIEAGLIIQGIDTELSSSDGVLGSSSVTVRGGSLNLFGSDGIDIYANNYVRFNNFGSGRDDSGTNFPTNFLYTDGSGNLQSAPTSLLSGGGSSLSSQDEGTLLTSTTTGYNFIGAGVTATELGGLVTVNIPGGAGSGLTLQTNGVTNINQSLLNLVAGTNVSLADNGSGGVTITGPRWYAENAAAPGTAPTATGARSIAIGDNAQALSTDMFVFGFFAGQGATSAEYSHFLGNGAGRDATNASNSMFIGSSAGRNATNANHSNFFGSSAGFTATNASNSNFFGFNAGMNATSASNSNFLGLLAGKNATNASYSNFIGKHAGYGATNASYSNFIGENAGQDATNASYSNFIGKHAGYGATNASYSNFIGSNVGQNATNAANSIFIGVSAGYGDTVDNTTNSNNFSILLGNYSSTGGFSNSIALGAYATNTATNQFMIGSATRPINETKIIGSAGTECTITTGTGIACTSDETLKTNITELSSSDILQKLQTIQTVSYNWKQNPNSPKQLGFLAQNLEQQFPELVITDATGKKQVYYAQMTPLLVAAVKELNIQISTIEFEITSTNSSFFERMKNWLADTGNGIVQIVAKRFRATEELCVDDQCFSADDIRSLKSLIGSSTQNTSSYHSNENQESQNNESDELAENQESQNNESDELAENQESQNNESDELAENQDIETIETSEEFTEIIVSSEIE